MITDVLAGLLHILLTVMAIGFIGSLFIRHSRLGRRWHVWFLQQGDRK